MERLNTVVTMLKQAQIPAGAAMPDRERMKLTSAVAAVRLGNVDQQKGTEEVLVQILSPRKLGAWHCQERAVRAVAVLNTGGYSCRMEEVTYEPGCDGFGLTIHARMTVENRQTGKLTYKGFTWPRNPERFLIEAVREPEYTKATSGAVTYKGLGALCRTITGGGVFSGENAAASYKALAAFLEAETPGALVHPVWGSFSACLMELKMEPESRENWIVYSFVFREADAQGSIPALSTGNNWVIYDM